MSQLFFDWLFAYYDVLKRSLETCSKKTWNLRSRKSLKPQYLKLRRLVSVVPLFFKLSLPFPRQDQKLDTLWRALFGWIGPFIPRSVLFKCNRSPVFLACSISIMITRKVSFFNYHRPRQEKTEKLRFKLNAKPVKSSVTETINFTLWNKILKTIYEQSLRTNKTLPFKWSDTLVLNFGTSYVCREFSVLISFLMKYKQNPTVIIWVRDPYSPRFVSSHFQL